MAAMSTKCQIRIQRDMDMVRGHYPVHEESPFVYHVFEDHHHLKITIPTSYPFQCIVLNASKPVNICNYKIQVLVSLYSA